MASLLIINPTDSLVPRFYGQQKLQKPGVPACAFAPYRGFPLYNNN